jgi:hypothetical protein
MPWTPQGDAVCDTCGVVRAADGDRHHAIQIIRAGGWHHAAGKTLGGADFEAILCARCARDERRRTRQLPLPQQEALPFDWENWRHTPDGQGFQSR